MKIHIPNSAFLGNIDQFIRSFDSNNADILEITANKKWIAIHPVVLAMLASLGLSCLPKDIKIENLEATSKHYLIRMNLFKILGLDTDIQINEHEAAGRFIPLTQIRNTLELTDFIREMVPLLHLNPDQVEPIRYVISELTRNVFEHSKSKTGAILCAQYFKKSNRISLGIVDRGIGIKESISKSHPAETDEEALKLSLTPGITGTTTRIGGTDYNAGAGLFFIKSIAKVNRDFFVIYSGSAFYKLLKTPVTQNVRLYGDPFRDKHSLKDGLPYWQGTVVGVDLSLDNREEFNMLLKLIRDTYTKTVRERRNAHYKEPIFI